MSAQSTRHSSLLACTAPPDTSSSHWASYGDVLHCSWTATADLHTRTLYGGRGQPPTSCWAAAAWLSQASHNIHTIYIIDSRCAVHCWCSVQPSRTSSWTQMLPAAAAVPSAPAAPRPLLTARLLTHNDHPCSCLLPSCLHASCSALASCVPRVRWILARACISASSKHPTLLWDAIGVE